MVTETAPDLWVQIGGLIAALAAGAAGYFGRELLGKSSPKVDPVITGIGLALGDKEQSERLIDELRRIAVALEALADKRQSEIDEKLEELLERIPDKSTPRRR